MGIPPILIPGKFPIALLLVLLLDYYLLACGRNKVFDSELMYYYFEHLHKCLV